MACGTGCCAPPSPQAETAQATAVGQPSTAPTASNSEVPVRDSCCSGDTQCQDVPVPNTANTSSSADACCDTERPLESTGGKTCQDKCCPSEVSSCGASVRSESSDGCAAACCAGKETEAVDDCCTGEASSSANKCGMSGPTSEAQTDSCADACCSKETPPSKAPATPDCCVGESSPCCDESCLNKLAVRECRQSNSCSDAKTSLPSGIGKSKSCETHARSTQEKYAAKIEALGCLCRALLALGQESCCAPRQKSSVERRRCSRKSSTSSRSSVDSCCATGISNLKSSTTVRVRGKAKGAQPGCGKPSSGCCSSEKEAGAVSVDCCEKPGVCTNRGTPRASFGSQCRDPETGRAGREHVILSVTGMTCTGCETSLKKALAGLSTVKNPKTSLLQSKAEFDLNAGSVSSVMKHIERTTPFKCEQVSDTGTNVDVIVLSDPFEFVNNHDEWPLGVLDVTHVEKNTVNISYDPDLVGARDLVEKGWNRTLHLAPPRADATIEKSSKHVRKIGLMTLLSTILTIPVVVMAWAPLPEREIAYGSASLALATLVQVLIAGPFYPKALKALVFTKMIEMDLLIVLSTTAAYVFSVVSFGYLVVGQPLSTGEFFETSTLLVTLIMVGRYVAAIARQKAVESISIRSLQAPTAIIVEETGEREIDARLLQYADTFKVLPDCKIPTDGTVISGSSEVDESMVTGESRPVEKYFKNHVIAGSINGSGTLLVRLARLPGQNTISTIANMVDEVAFSKPKLQELADKVASYFVPVVGVFFLITFCAWIGVGIRVQNMPASEAVVQAVTFAITVLIVSCPCAVGLAVPMVIVIASGIAAARGVIIKDSTTIEIAKKTSHVVFDKTGTLTEGRLTVESEVYIKNDGEDGTNKGLLLALLSGNKHPVSAAVAARLQDSGVQPASEVRDIKVLTGKGVEATTSSGLVLRAGNSRWLDASSDTNVESALSQGLTAFCFTIDGAITAIFGLQDTLRADAASTAAELHRRGIAVHVLSGDDAAAVHTITNRLSIPADRVRARCHPADKQAYIQALQSTSANPPTVIFCGDGTNDAVALAQATIGVHMSGGAGGTDVAKSAADVVLMRPDLAGVLTLIDVSAKSVRRIWFNFGWSALYNVFAVLLGGGAFVGVRGGVRIPPAFAGLGELVSVLPVVAAAVVMRWEKI